MTEENIEAVKQLLEKDYTNVEVSSFREEFDGWKEEDQIGEDDNAFFLYPERVRRLDPYNLAVLLESADELDEVKNEIKWAWGDAWNQGIMDNYYTTNETLILNIHLSKFYISKQIKTNKKNNKNLTYILNYLHTHPNITLKFIPPKMGLHVHFNDSYILQENIILYK